MNEQTTDANTAGFPPEIPGNISEWYYVDNGVRKGPISPENIKDLLNKKQIQADTQVWRKGMGDWKSIRESDLAEFVHAVPPAVSPLLIGNGLVWIIAILPLLFGLIDAAIVSDNQRRLATALVIGSPYHLAKGLPWYVPFLSNIAFGWFDERRLRRAGYSSHWMTAAYALLMPVYLVIRAKRLQQRPSYAIVWIVMFILGAFLVGAASS